MVRCVCVELAGRKFYPTYNNRAMFTLQERTPDFLDKMEGISEDSVKLSFEIFTTLCEEGAAARRAYGYEDTGDSLEWEDVLGMMPYEIARMKDAILAAVTAGLDSKAPKQEELVDLTLIELQKKTE